MAFMTDIPAALPGSRRIVGTRPFGRFLRGLMAQALPVSYADVEPVAPAAPRALPGPDAAELADLEISRLADCGSWTELRDQLRAQDQIRHRAAKAA